MTAIDQTIKAAQKRIMGSAEELAQAFSDRHNQRLGDLLTDIALATVAGEMGPGGRAIAAKHARWSPQWINRLELVGERNLPDHLIDPDLPVGVYWSVLMSDLSQNEQYKMLAQAIELEWSVADAKRALGQEAKSTGGSVYKAEVAEHNGTRAVVTGDELGAVQLEPGSRVSVRVLK